MAVLKAIALELAKPRRLELSPERALAMRRLGWPILAQAMVGAALCARYLSFVDTAGAASAVRLEAPLACAVLGAAIAVVLSIPALAMANLRPSSPRAALVCLGALGWAHVAFLLLDGRIYALTRLHLDPDLLRTLAQPHALSTIGVSSRSVGEFLAVLLVAGVLEGIGVALLARLSERVGHLSSRAASRVALAFLAGAALDRLAYSLVGTSLVDSRSDIAAALPYPAALSPRLPIEIAEYVFGMKDAYRRDVSLDIPARLPSQLRYPGPAALAWKPATAKRMNVLLIAIESLRADMVDPQTMPNLYALSLRSTSFERHYAGSNCTHVSLFTLLYGLSPAVWSAISETGTPPWTYSALEQLGYRVSVTSSNTINWFGINKLAFPPERALGDYTNRPDYDDLAAADLARLVGQADARPQFAFLFFNASHFPYLFPKEDAPFIPYLETVDAADPELVHHRAELINRYRNSLHHIDRLLGSVLDAVHQRGHDDDTIIAVTGDHGESFWDDGRLSHTSFLSSAQLHVPFILHVPGQAPARVGTVTGHEDVMPTLLDAVGSALPPDAYSDGEDLGRPTPRPRLAAQCSPVSLRQFAVIDADGLVRFERDDDHVRITGEESLDGRALPAGAEPELRTRSLPKVLTVMHETARWWPSN